MPLRMAWVDTWVGGRVWEDKAGRRTFIIRKSMRGKRWEVSTRCSTERAAIKALERFEQDPEGFQAGEDVIADGLALDEKLVDQFIAYSRDMKGNTPRWCDVQKRLLDSWRQELAGKSLKRLDLGRDVIPHLDGVRELKNRIATLKALFGWLRKVRHLITSNQDCSRDLSVPQAKPAQATRSKVISVKDEERLLAALPHEWAVRRLLLSKTGMHLTELESFVNGGRVEQRGDDWVLVLPHTKRGPEHRIVISTAGVEVAKEALALRQVLRKPDGSRLPSGLEEARRAGGRLAGPRRHPSSEEDEQLLGRRG